MCCVLGCNRMYRFCIGSVLYTGWRYKKLLLSTVFLQLVSSSTVFVWAFYCIPNTWTSTVLSSTVFIPVIRYRYTVLEWYRNDVQNGTIRYLSNTVYREYGIGTVPVSTVQQYWNGTVQYRDVYWDWTNKRQESVKKKKTPLHIAILYHWCFLWH